MAKRAGRRRIWIADDSPTDAARAQKALQAQHEVEVFTDGAMVVERLAAGAAPDVLVLDWMMPGLSGLDVCRFVRGQERKVSEVGILLLTAQRESAQIVEALDAGANDYVCKPYAPEELQARVAALVRSRELLERAETAEQSLRDLLAQAPDALLSISDGGEILFVNEEAARALGKPVEEIVGRQISTLMPDLALGNLLPGSTVGFVPLPDVQLGECLYAPRVRVPSAAAGAYMVSLRDVTEQRNAEARRLDFYSIIAHDLRTPLSAMMLRLGMMLTGRYGVLKPELVRDIQKLQGNIRGLVSMVNDFLDLGRMEGSGFRVEQAQVDLTELARHLIDDFRPLLQTSALECRYEGPEAPVIIVGDRARLSQVLSNLIGNAVKFTPAGGTITVRVQDEAQDVEVQIQDTGPGISPEAQRHLFQRYARIRGDNDPVGGTGLGLMIVREIVQAHNGSVGVRSQTGEGSTFWVRLPRQSAAA